MSFESLNVTANIASGCAFLGSNSAEYVCPVMDPESGWEIFSDYDNCSMVLPNNDTICYDIPLVNNNVFES